MSISSIDLGNIKEALRDLKREIKSNTQVVEDCKKSLDMNNLLMLVNLGILSKDDLIETEIYKSYTQKNFPKQKKKSIF